MKLFSVMYDMVMRWAAHPRAERYLAAMSAAESVFFPVPVDVMLAPMALGRPEQAWRFAALATVFSALGGVLGYLLGMFFYEAFLADLLVRVGYQESFTRAEGWFEDYGIWVVFIAGFTPIPYKVFTIAAGVMSASIGLAPFFLISLVSRGLRFFMVAGLMRWGGAAMEAKLRQYVDLIGWAVLGAAVLAYVLLRWT